MKYYELDAEEQKLLEAVEAGEFKVVKNPEKRKKEMQAAAVASGNKTRHINIRVSEKVLYKLKARAEREGVPYQTLVSSLLHQNL
jgi:predicted DNA binding CopG/RHH family protein